MVKKDFEQEAFNKELENKVKVNYYEFDSKCDETYRKCVENKYKFYINKKLVLISCATIMLIMIMLIIFLNFSGNDINISEEIVLEEQEIVQYSVEKTYPFFLSIDNYGFVIHLLFFDEDMVFKIYCSKGYIDDFTNDEYNGLQEKIIEKREKSVFIQWSPFKSMDESINLSKKKFKRRLRQCNDTDLYISCIKNDLIIGIAIIHFDIDIPDEVYNYGIIGKKEASYVFKDEYDNIQGVSEKQLLSIMKKIQKEG